ncbi:MAG: hypothetical protein RH949_13325 [Coleofasciculus sp. A1-SPW-01]|uniref:hypothetical protein n=1 Tax=Coleofasciculus sp. A1-SPW-01 TaxID=3070819 RepID=UPI0032F175FB
MGFTILAIIIILALWAYRRYRHSYQPLTEFQKLALPRREPTPQVKTKLINLVGSLDEAERQVARARFADPGRSEAWYWWKAIQNLTEKPDEM